MLRTVSQGLDVVHNKYSPFEEQLLAFFELNCQKTFVS